MEKPLLIYQKNADKVMGRVMLPKKFIEQWGREFYMEVYEDKIILKPKPVNDKQRGAQR